MVLCEKAVAAALAVLKDAEASFWDKAEAESYLRSEMIRPTVWIAGKAVSWRVYRPEGCWMTNDPERVFAQWLAAALAEA